MLLKTFWDFSQPDACTATEQNQGWMQQRQMSHWSSIARNYDYYKHELLQQGTFRSVHDWPVYDSSPEAQTVCKRGNTE